jgi:hypothetical protein
MENQEAPKRTYKKHKEGFKITVNHKLNIVQNTIINYKDLGFIPSYPLYVEIRVHRQRTFFRSSHNFNVNPHDFDQFLKDIFVQKLILEESNDIKNHILNYPISKDYFDIKEWLYDYQQSKNRKLVENNLIDYCHKFIDSFVFDHPELQFPIKCGLLNEDNILESVKSLSAVMKYYGEKSFGYLYEVINAYDSLIEILDNCEHLLFSPELEVSCNLSSGLTTTQILNPDFLLDRLPSIYKKSYLSNIEIIRKFINNEIKNV